MFNKKKKEKKPLAVIVSKEEAYWAEVKENTEKDIERLERLLKFQNAILEMCNTKIENEKQDRHEIK